MFVTPGSRAGRSARTLQRVLPAVAGGSNSIADCRLTLVSGTPVMTTSQTAKTSVLLTPRHGNNLALWNGESWAIDSFSEVSASLSGLTANTLYDVFGYVSAGALLLELVAWADSAAGTSARATAIAYKDGVAVKSGDPTRRYYGTIRTTGTTGECEHSLGGSAAGGSPAFLGVWNMYNRAPFSCFVRDNTNSWTYSAGSGWRASNNSVGNRVSFVRGVQEDGMTGSYGNHATNGAGNAAHAGIALDATNTNHGTGDEKMPSTNAAVSAQWAGNPGDGFHYLQATENIAGSGSATIYGDNNDAPMFGNGLIVTGRY